MVGYLSFVLVTVCCGSYSPALSGTFQGLPVGAISMDLPRGSALWSPGHCRPFSRYRKVFSRCVD